MVILSIDTTDSTKTTVWLEKNGKKVLLEESTHQQKSQNVLPLIEKILDQEKVSVGDLTGITVNCGPGSFTGTRVGVTVANALGWILSIPINGKRIPALPIYTPSSFD